MVVVRKTVVISFKENVTKAATRISDLVNDVMLQQSRNTRYTQITSKQRSGHLLGTKKRKKKLSP